MDTEVTGGSAKEGTSAVDLPIVDVEKDAAMKPLFHRRADCRLCHSSAVEVVVPLAPIPVATPNVGAATVAGRSELAAALAPLDLYLCRDCGHLQLLDVINPEVQYNNFAYTTAISLGLTEHFGRMADAVIAHAGLAPGDLVVEVGSNDGTLLRFFKERGMSVLGIDPARAIAAAATAAGIETIALFFTDELAAQIRDERGPARRRHREQHLRQSRRPRRPAAASAACSPTTAYSSSRPARRGRDPAGCWSTRSTTSTCPISWSRRLLISSPATAWSWSTVEHLNQGWVDPRLCRSSPAARDAAVLVGGHDRRAGAPRARRHRQFRRAERRFSTAWRRTAAADVGGGCGRPAGRPRRLWRLGRHGDPGQPFELGRVLDFIADDKPLTQALLGPGYRIPVVAPDALYAQRPDLVVILAWRYAEPIMAKHRRYTEGGGRFVVP